MRSKRREIIYTGFGVALVDLDSGEFAVIDEVDAEWAGRWNWRILSNSKETSRYALRNQCIDGKWKSFRLHREIARRSGLNIEGFEVDHINGDRLDNRRSNLRTATDAETAANCKMPKHNTSGFKGVSWKKQNSRWSAQIGHAGKLLHLGYFDTPEEASAAYEAAAVELFQDFKRPKELY